MSNANQRDLFGGPRGSPFSKHDGELKKREGMQRAADKREDQLALARFIARRLALTRGDRCVTADDVGRELFKLNSELELGAAAGSIFKSSDWQWTGVFVKSERTKNHGRLLRVWRFVGKDAPP